MSRGFVTIGIDTEQDQVKYSYALALSVKQSDPNSEVCLIVDKDKSDTVPGKYYDAFDYIVELPFGNSGHKDGFHGSNLWQLIHCSPFEETIYLDNDTIVKNTNIELLWDTYSNCDFAVSDTAKSYRNVSCDKRKRFEIEKQYNLPQLYFNFIYFKRDSQTAIEWFKMADPVFQNWREVYNVFFKEKKPPTFDKNIVCNLITHLLDLEDEIKQPTNMLYDFNAVAQGLWHEDIPSEWTEILNYWYTDKHKVMVENNVINSGIIHYQDKGFLTDDIIGFLRTAVENSNRRKATA